MNQKNMQLKSIPKENYEKIKYFGQGFSDGKGYYYTAYEELINEIQILQQLAYPNIIIELYEVMEGNDDDDDDDDEEEEDWVSDGEEEEEEQEKKKKEKEREKEEAADGVYLIISLAEGGSLMEYHQEEECFHYSILLTTILSSILYSLVPEFSRHKSPLIRLVPSVILTYLEQICEALLYLHGKGIAHRDLKPMNLFVTRENTIKIGDFGCSKQFDSKQNPKGFICDTFGTITFWAPESLKPEQYKHDQDIGLDYEENIDENDGRRERNNNEKAYSAYGLDIWALGITLFSMVFHQLPFTCSERRSSFTSSTSDPLSSHPNVINLIEEICSAPIVFQYHPIYDLPRDTERSQEEDLLQMIITGLLEKEPSQRWMLDNVLELLKT